MANAFEHPASRESRDVAPRSAWHRNRSQLLALALLIPTPAAGKEQVTPPPSEAEHIAEDRDAFFERLETAARTSPTETSWAHFTTLDGPSLSIHTSVKGTEDVASVYVDTRAVVAHALAGDEVILCHTHPERTAEEAPNPVPLGQPLPMDAPSMDDIETYLNRLSLLSRLSGSEDVAFIVMQRLQDCVVTTNGGYWQLEAAELEPMRARLAAIERYATQSFNEAAALIDERSKSPEFMEMLMWLPPEKFKDEPIINRILQFVYTVDTKSSDHGLSPELVRLVETIRDRKSQLQGEPGFERVGEFFTRFFDSTRTSEQSAQDLTAYLSFVREEFGIKITWHPISSDE